MQPKEVELPEKDTLQRKGHRNPHQKGQQLREPDLLRPKGSDQRHGDAPTPMQLEQNWVDQGKRRKGINDQPVPGLEYRIRTC